MIELEAVVKALNKKFGKGYIGTGNEVLQTDYTRGTLGTLALDYAIGGGLPERKIVMIAGKPSSGKTTTSLIAAAQYQAAGGKVCLIDVEHGFDAIWATKLGVKVEDMYFAQSKTIEEITDTVEPLIMTGAFSLIIIDSIAAASSTKELEDSAEQKSYGGNAKANGLMIRKMTAALNDCKNPVKTSVMMLNQIRDNIGGWGAPEYTPGGQQLHFQSDIIVWLRPDSKPVNGKDDPRGITIKFKVTKNRTAPPMKVGTYDLLFEGKIDNRKSSIELGVVTGVIGKVGYKYTFKDKSVTDLKPFMLALTDEDFNEIGKLVVEAVKNGAGEIKDTIDEVDLLEEIEVTVD